MIKTEKMTHREKQSEFAFNVGALIIKAYSLNYEITLDDAYRDPRCVYGSPKTAHRKRLAVYLNLFKHGRYLKETRDHRILGEWWESIGGIRGGRFDDGNHYEWPDK